MGSTSDRHTDRSGEVQLGEAFYTLNTRLTEEAVRREQRKAAAQRRLKTLKTARLTVDDLQLGQHLNIYDANTLRTPR